MTIYTRLNIPWTCPVCRQSVAADVFHLCRPRGKPLLMRIAHWWDDNWPNLLFGGFIAGVIGVCVMVVIAHDDARRDFMVKCQADHKEYECELAWRQADAGIATSVATGIAIGTVMSAARGGYNARGR